MSDRIGIKEVVVLVVVMLLFAWLVIERMDRSDAVGDGLRMIYEKLESMEEQQTTIMLETGTSPGRFYEDMTITAYTAREEETDSTPEYTALMECPIPGYTVAVSRDLMKYLGWSVYIEGYGVWRVNDLMNPRYEKRIDLCVPHVDVARSIGVKERRVVFFH